MAQNYYRELDCPDYQSINLEIIEWVTKHNIVDQAKVFWNPVSTVDFMKSNKKFSMWCLDQNLKIQNIVVTVFKENDRLLRPHIDTPPARFKLSWPVLNADHTWNRWYQTCQETADCVINPYGGVSYTDRSQLIEIARRKLTGPALIDAGIMHDVELADDQVYPRIGLQCQIFNEPDFL